MKKQFLIIGVAFLIGACSNQESLDTDLTLPSKEKSFQEIRSYEEALEIAKSAIPMLDSDNTPLTRSVKDIRKIDTDKKEVLKLDRKTRTETNINDTLIYVFNFENNEGFVLVSASKNTDGLLAITDKGHCDPNERSEIGGFEMFKEMAKEYVCKASVIHRSPVGPIVETRDSITYSNSTVGPYVTVRWGQENPEGEFYDNGLSGCSNTAMAQVMSYYNYPTSINLTYAGADVSSQNLNWTDMKAHSTGHELSSCSTPDTHKAIGRLLRELGNRNHSYYSALGTATPSCYLPLTFSDLGYSCDSLSNYNSQTVRIELNQAHLYLVEGRDGMYGHMWTLDGYLKRIATIREMARTATSGWFFTGIVNYETSYYLHFNWGRYGDCNGYFAEGVYDTTNAFQYDTAGNIANRNYATDVKFLSAYR